MRSQIAGADDLFHRGPPLGPLIHRGSVRNCLGEVTRRRFLSAREYLLNIRRPPDSIDLWFLVDAPTGARHEVASSNHVGVRWLPVKSRAGICRIVIGCTWIAKAIANEALSK